MSYIVVLAPPASRQLKKLGKQEPAVAQELLQAIIGLEDEPRPKGCKKLKKTKNTYRVRRGNYRIVYIVEDQVLTVTVVAAGDRRSVYKLFD
jgi:mRNA interferase RelE/StbE